MAEHDDALILAIEERLQRFRTEIGIDGDGIRTKMVERRYRILLIRRSDVGTFRIQNDRHVWRGIEDVEDRFSQRGNPLLAARFIEGVVGFIRANEVLCGIDDGAIEGNDGLSRTLLLSGLWNTLEVSIESYAQKLSLVPLRFEKFPKISHTYCALSYQIEGQKGKPAGPDAVSATVSGLRPP